MSALEFHAVTFEYPGRDAPALDDVIATCPDGDVVLVLGASGSGKSTLLRAANGLVPHHSGGSFRGDVLVAGRSTRTTLPRDLAAEVGFVHQDPEAQFVTDRVEADVAFGLENLGLDATAMRRRVEEVLDALGITHLRDRHPGTLSGGEQQRCAIAGAVATGPRVLALDEPTSQLDPQGAESVLTTLRHLNEELGTTVLMAEHRLERVVPFTDRVLTVEAGRVAMPADPAATIAAYEGAPSVMRLAQLLGWETMPITVRDARRAAEKHAFTLPTPRPHQPRTPGAVTATASGVSVRYGRTTALQPVDLAFHEGEVTVVLGRNGAGKSSLLRALAGLERSARGTVRCGGRIAYVPQNPNSLLFARTVRAEVAETLSLLRRTDADGAEVAAVLERFGLTEVADRYPRDLSGGQRQRVAIAAVAVGDAPVLLLDEPTRGMDATSRRALERMIRDHADRGGSVVLATHDVELAARIADRAIVLTEGECIADGDAHTVLGGSLFAPQVARVLPGFLTVEAVVAALEAGT